MGTKARTRRARAAASSSALLAALVVAVPDRAGASAVAASPGQEAVGSGTWGAVATQSSASPPPTGPLVRTVTTNNAFYFQVVNDGTVSLTGITYAVTVTTSKAKVALTACSVAWVQTGPGTCAGTTTTVSTWINGNPGGGQVASGTAVASTTAPAAAASQIYLRATPGGVPGSGTTFTFDMSVASTQIRAGQTTNS